MPTTDPRIAATRRYLASRRDTRLKEFSWMSNRALGRAGGMSAGRRDKLMADLLAGKTDIEESYRSQLGLQEAQWKREEDLKRAQGQAATIKTIGTILGLGAGFIPVAGTLASGAVRSASDMMAERIRNATAGAGFGAGVAGLAATAATGEPETAAMAPNELIAAIQGLSSTDYIDRAMAAIGGKNGRMSPEGLRTRYAEMQKSGTKFPAGFSLDEYVNLMSLFQ